MTESDPLAERDAELAIVFAPEEKVLSVPPVHTPQTIGTDNLKQQATRYFAPAGRLGALFGAIKSEDIKISRTNIVFRPYWRITGGYACRYLRRHSHKLSVENDVESVTIYGKEQSVTAEKIRLSDLLANIGASASLGYGPVQLSLGPLQDILKGRLSAILGGKDKELEKKVELNIGDIIETATFTYTGTFLFDANVTVESKEIFDLVKNRDLQPAPPSKLKKDGMVVDVTFSKEQVIDEVRKRLCKEPEERPRRIVEQVFRISEMSLIYLPVYDFTLECKGKMRTIRLNGITGEINPT